MYCTNLRYIACLVVTQSCSGCSRSKLRQMNFCENDGSIQVTTHKSRTATVVNFLSFPAALLHVCVFLSVSVCGNDHVIHSMKSPREVKGDEVLRRSLTLDTHTSLLLRLPAESNCHHLEWGTNYAVICATHSACLCVCVCV